MTMATKAGAPLIGLLAAVVGLSSSASTASQTGSAILTCATSMLETGRPLGQFRDNQVVLGRAALPRTSFVLQLGRTETLADWGFAKHGFVIRNGITVTLEVPGAYRGRYLLAAAYVRGNVASITFHPCPDYHLGNWTVWVGGYSARRPICAPLIVHSGQRSARVTISIGRRCR
jgi:hypothetical protein